MSRPRIRSIKPEMWQDEKIGRLSRDARCLFCGLISFADDDGRFRALPAAILGHVFPYDPDAPRKLTGWMDELMDEGLVFIYEVDGLPYGVLPKWHSHQKINRFSPSLLPEPSGNAHVQITERSVSSQ